MRTIATTTLIVLLSITVIAVPYGMSAEPAARTDQETTTGYMIADLLLMRPLGMGATVLGSVMFVLALPFTAATGDTRYSYEKLIKEPAEYTFKRSLGFF